MAGRVRDEKREKERRSSPETQGWFREKDGRWGGGLGRKAVKEPNHPADTSIFLSSPSFPSLFLAPFLAK